MTTALSLPEYAIFLAALKERVVQARTRAARSVNRDLILLYWDIGRGILEKQKLAGWGEAVVQRLAADLRTEFPDMRGFSTRNIWDMRRFYAACTEPAFLSLAGPALARDPKSPFLRQLVAEIPWGQHLLILNKLTAPATRLDEVKSAWTTIDSALHNANLSFTAHKPQYFSYATGNSMDYYGSSIVWSRSLFSVRLGDDFWSAPITGEDSQAGTIIHELTHMYLGTGDHAYDQWDL